MGSVAAGMRLHHPEVEGPGHASHPSVLTGGPEDGDHPAEHLDMAIGVVINMTEDNRGLRILVHRIPHRAEIANGLENEDPSLHWDGFPVVTMFGTAHAVQDMHDGRPPTSADHGALEDPDQGMSVATIEIVIGTATTGSETPEPAARATKSGWHAIANDETKWRSPAGLQGRLRRPDTQLKSRLGWFFRTNRRKGDHRGRCSRTHDQGQSLVKRSLPDGLTPRWVNRNVPLLDKSFTSRSPAGSIPNRKDMLGDLRGLHKRR